MSKNKKLRYILALMPAALFCLSSCKTAGSDFCPTYPVAGPLVAAELAQASYQAYPNTWEWLGRINKLRQELELCRSDF